MGGLRSALFQDKAGKLEIRREERKPGLGRVKMLVCEAQLTEYNRNQRRTLIIATPMSRNFQARPSLVTNGGRKRKLPSQINFFLLGRSTLITYL